MVPVMTESDKQPKNSRIVCTRLSGNLLAAFEQLAKSRGLSLYEALRHVVEQYLAEHGYVSNEMVSLQAQVQQLWNTVRSNVEQLDQLSKRIQELEQQLKQLKERYENQGLARFMKK